MNNIHPLALRDNHHLQNKNSSNSKCKWCCYLLLVLKEMFSDVQSQCVYVVYIVVREMPCMCRSCYPVCISSHLDHCLLVTLYIVVPIKLLNK